MLKLITDHPIFTIIGGVFALIGVVTAILGLTEPKFALVTDAKVCGVSTQEVVTTPYQFRECKNPNKLLGFEFQDVVSKSSGWVGGGRNPSWHCFNVMREMERAIGESIDWGTPKTSEESKKDWKGHVTYNYHCTIEAKWGPIYAVERWEGCGEADPVVEKISEPKTCFDTTKRVGWKWKWE